MGTGLPGPHHHPSTPTTAAPSKTSRGKLSARPAVNVESPPWLGFSFLSRLLLTDPINPGVHSSRGPSSHSSVLPGLETSPGPYELALVLVPVTLLQHNNLLTKTPKVSQPFPKKSDLQAAGYQHAALIAVQTG